MGDLRVTLSAWLANLSRLTKARLGYTAGRVQVAAGVAICFGPGVALIVAGVICAASFLLLADVENPARRGGR